MSTKTANVMVRVEPEIKEQAEAVMSELGLPVSVVINALYRQIIYRNAIPFTFSVPSIKSRESLSDKEFDEMIEKGMQQAETGNGISLEEAMARLRENIK